MTTEQTTSPKDNPLVRALARWEWEGGHLAPDREKSAALAQEEEHILQWLGAAVVTRGIFNARSLRAPFQLANRSPLPN